MPLLRIIKRDEATIGLWEMVDGEFDTCTDVERHDEWQNREYIP